MRGVILAGGTGSRLWPLTEVCNKHLLPIAHQPMLFYPLQTLAEAGVEEVMVVVGGHSTGEIVRLCQDGQRFGLRRLYYGYQKGEGGISDAISVAEEFVNGHDAVVLLGDNLFFGGVGGIFNDFFHQRYGARVVLAKVDNPLAYGCPIFDENDRIEKIVEKPQAYSGNSIVSGLYFYDNSLFTKIRGLKLSNRQELEVTDLNNLYARDGMLEYSLFHGDWLDAGESIEALNKASDFVLKEKGFSCQVLEAGR